MATGPRHVDLEEIGENPQAWRALVEEVRASRQPCIIRMDGEDTAVLSPAKAKKTRVSDTKGLTHEDALWGIVSIVTEDNGPIDVSSNKQKYLAEAYQPKRG